MDDAAHPADVSIRDARPEDVDDVLRLIHELADYEREPDAVTATVEDVRNALFPAGASPAAYTLLAVRQERVVGFALWFPSYSTWTGKQGIWLEDLFVEPAQRGLGIGRALLARLAALCVERGWTRLEWVVLDWNEPSIEFYRAQGARALDEWLTFRLDGDALSRMAQS